MARARAAVTAAVAAARGVLLQQLVQPGRVVIGDGRALLEDGLGPWDLVFLDADTIVMPGHGLDTTIGAERMVSAPTAKSAQAQATAAARV